MPMRTEALPVEWLLSAEEAWTAVLEDSEAHRIFGGWAWASTWVRHFQAMATPTIIGCFDGNDLVAIAPWCSHRRSLSPVDSLEFLGQAIGGADHLDVICRRGYEAEVADALATTLRKRQLIAWDTGHFVTSSGQSMLERVLRGTRGDWPARRTARGAAPYLTLEGNWRSFLAGRFDKKRRYNIERQIRLAIDRAGLKVEIAAVPEQAPDRIAELFRLHDLRKARQGESSAFTAAAAKDFHAELIGQLARNGQAVLASLRGPTGAVASACCFRAGGVVSYFQSGMDPAYERDSVGTTLLALLIKDALETGQHEFDFLRGAEPYKFSWANGQRDIVESSLFRNGLLGQVARMWCGGKAWGRKALRSLRGPGAAQVGHAP